MRFQGLVYRALNPRWALQPLSGEGARRHGGRFNPKGVPALYTSLSVMTAIREANQIGTLQPTTLVSYQADLEPLFNATDAQALESYSISPPELAADDWRNFMGSSQNGPTQRFAIQLIEDGFCGMRVRSFARGATADDQNLVLWTWGSHRPTRLILNDDEGRLRAW